MTENIMKNQNITDFRTLNISNFRNLGVYATDDNKDDRAFLKINRCLRRENLGGLVLLMGLNNSGKSNVLDALEYLNNLWFYDEDAPDFLLSPVDPKIEMNISNGKYESDGFYSSRLRAKYTPHREEDFFDFLSRVYCQEESYVFLQKDNLLDDIIENHPRITLESASAYIEFMSSFIRIFKSEEYISNPTDREYVIGLLALVQESISSKYVYFQFKSEIIEILDTIIEDIRENSTRKRVSKYRESIHDVWTEHLRNASDEDFMDENNSWGNTFTDTFFKDYGYELSTRILRYTEKPLNRESFRCASDSPNDFFNLLLKVTGKHENSYEHLYANDNRGLRNKFRKEFNKDLLKISNDFNRLFTADSENTYLFEVDFEREMMYFLMDRGKIPLDIDKQSEGFTWIFNFYLNFLMVEDFIPGDIVLLDEFGYNLNPLSVKEIIVQLRNFGREYGITFVIATQNFMVVDVNHLDEVRLVINESNGNSRILNNFEQFNHESHDVLYPIMGSLTVGRNFLKNENRRTIFVEGSSDYFFMTAMAEGLRHHKYSVRQF